MEQENIDEIKKKIGRGVVALTSRTFFLQFISFISLSILSAILTPAIFAVFSIVSAVISFLSYFSDIGLAGALIQKKENPTKEQLNTVFIIQQILVASLVFLLFIYKGQIASFFNIGQDGEFLFVALLVSFFMSSLKTIPSILLERRLEFSLLIIPQILENITYHLLTIVLAIKGFQLYSFAWAALARGVVGLIAIYIIQPWRVSSRFNFSSLKGLFSFGIPFQINSVLALIKDDLMVIFLAKLLPLAEVGYITWAKKWAEVPLRLIMDSIIRVTFPAFARLQHDKMVLSQALNKSAFFLALTIVPSTLVLIILFKPLVLTIQQYHQWQPALIPFYLFSISAILAGFSSPFVNALNALGKIKKTLILMIIWTVLTWGLVPFLAIKIGYKGVSIAAFLISFTSILPIWMVKAEFHFSFISSVKKPILIAMIIFSSMMITIQFQSNIYITLASLWIATMIYLAAVWYFFKDQILPYLPKIGLNSR